MKCKFCGCTDERACQIPMVMCPGDPAEYPRQYPRVALAGEVAETTEPCEWIAPNVCSAPRCVEKAYAEAELLADQLQFFIERGAA